MKRALLWILGFVLGVLVWLRLSREKQMVLVTVYDDSHDLFNRALKKEGFRGSISR